MNRSILIIFLALSCQQTVAAELSAEEQCSRLGKVAEQASQLRLTGVEMDKALKTVKQNYKFDGSDADEYRVNGAVRISYMAKMKPDKMREYYVSQCLKDVLK